jgi:hypothetical protein
LARETHKPKNEIVKKFLRAKRCPRGFESIESRGAKSLPGNRWLATIGPRGRAMLTRAIDRIEARLVPYAKGISVLALVWFWFGVAVTAGFIRLPELPWLSKPLVFWAGIAFNVVWWGFLRPAIESRRAAREDAEA